MVCLQGGAPDNCVEYFVRLVRFNTEERARSAIDEPRRLPGDCGSVGRLGRVMHGLGQFLKRHGLARVPRPSTAL